MGREIRESGNALQVGRELRGVEEKGSSELAKAVLAIVEEQEDGKGGCSLKVLEAVGQWICEK